MPAANAGTIVVTTTADGPGGCSLREAIRSANGDTDIGGCNDSGGEDRVKLPAGTYPLTRGGPSEEEAKTGDLDITDDLEVVGSGRGGTIVRSTIKDRIFQVFNATTAATISRITITGGRPQFSGGGVSSSFASLTLDRVAVRGNRSMGGAGGIGASGGTLVVQSSKVRRNTTGAGTAGGGLSASGAGTLLTVSDSTITGNRTSAFGGGIYTNSADATVERSVIRGNRADTESGGIHVLGGEMSVVDSRVSRNQADGAGTADGVGGGVQLAQVGDLTLVRTTVARNRSAESGGGIFIAGVSGIGLLIEESTISGNEAGDDGGGMRIVNGTVEVDNTTISGNRADDGGGGFYSGNAGSGTTPATSLSNATLARNVADADEAAGGAGGGFFQSNGSIALSNTIVAENSDLGTVTAPDCAGSVTANYSLFGSLTGCTIASGGNNAEAAPLLQPLAGNGGPTGTHALPAASPAVGAGNPVQPGTTGTACEVDDQRGVPRPQDAACEIGAYERATCFGRAVDRVGTPGADLMRGSNGPNVFLALGDNDTILARGGSDRACAGDGTDKVRGGEGNDHLDGGPGDDDCAGGPGKDELVDC